MSVRRVGPGFSPLDEALGLGGSRYSPQALEWLARLGAEVPFARAAYWLETLTGVVVSAATVRRQTEALGATAVTLAEAEVARLEREAPPPLAQPERLVLGADGAMVPLVGGEWAEVKLLSIGEPTTCATLCARGVRTQQVSYFARLADAETFGAQALGELHRRGGGSGGRRGGGGSGGRRGGGGSGGRRGGGAGWRALAARLRGLPPPRCAAHPGLAACRRTPHRGGRSGLRRPDPRAQRAAERLRRWLWEEGPTRVLAIVAGWERAQPHCPASVTRLATEGAYFRERAAQLDSPAFRAAGWPVGSGSTESGHKQVMQARMKRAGMRWGRPHVNPLLALTLLEHNSRWATDGPAVLAQHRTRLVQQRRQRRRQRQAARHTPPCPVISPHTPPPADSAPLPARRRRPPAPSAAPHPWRRYGPWLSAKM